MAPNDETGSNEPSKTMPQQLLAEIRNHNLISGSDKGSSFSRSIAVTESEKAKPDIDRDHSKTVETVEGATEEYEGDSLSHVKSCDDEDESSEEQISSALFVPHKTSHEPADRKRGAGQEGLDSITRPRTVEHRQSDSQEWLEEHQVPTREVNQNHLAPEGKGKGKVQLPSPISHVHAPAHKQDITIPEDIRTTEPHDDPGYSTKAEDSSLTDDPETTPKGHTRQEYKKHLHDHQQQPKKPLEAIELIPYKHQVGGHTTMWRFSKRAVCKQLNNRENEFYEKVERYHPDLLKFLPRYVYYLPPFVTRGLPS